MAGCTTLKLCDLSSYTGVSVTYPMSSMYRSVSQAKRRFPPNCETRVGRLRCCEISYRHDIIYFPAAAAVFLGIVSRVAAGCYIAQRL